MADRFTGLLIAVVVMLVCAGSAFAEAEFAKSSQTGALIEHHQLTAEFTPAEHRIAATDTVKLRPGGERTLRFALGKEVKVDSLKDDRGKDLVYKQVEDEELPEHLALYEVNVPKGVGGFTVVYSGVIYAPPQEEATLAHVRGGSSTGVIGEEGIYLDAGSGWYPVEDGSLATFVFTLGVAQPFMLVTQGDLLNREAKDGKDVSEWRSRIQQDGFTLVGNKFVVETRRANGVSLSTYFFEEDAALADQFLDATEEYLRFYTALLGDFPYNRFDIVENFFQTGYGMPGYTLLGDAVVKMVQRGGYDVTGPSGIAHELMHNWWGNYVFFDADRGNWCEAITTYMTNYYWLEAHGQDGEARQWRKQASIKYSVNAPPGKAYPLREFRWKENEADGAVGYEKGAMFFHHLRRLVGDQAFFAGLRQVIAERGASFATWDDFRRAFEQQSGAKLDSVFSQWLDRPGVPDFRLQMELSEDGTSVSARVEQQVPSWDLWLDFRAGSDTGSLQVESKILVTGESGWITFG